MENPDSPCSRTPRLGSPSKDELIELIVEQVKRVLVTDTRSIAHMENRGQGLPLIPLGVSNRHIHLTKKTFHLLFGEETSFESLRPLYQPGESASVHALTVVGPKLRSIPNVRILGPLRSYDQVEISLTDAIYLGINPPVANSGSLDNAAPLTLVGPKSSVYLERCAIIASRHIHMTTRDAQQLHVREGDLCRVRIPGDKSTVFENVLIRTNDNWLLQIHLDTDDANAANVRDDTYVEFLGKM